jgi:hypothetical protein
MGEEVGTAATRQPPTSEFKEYKFCVHDNIKICYVTGASAEFSRWNGLTTNALEFWKMKQVAYDVLDEI